MIPQGARPVHTTPAPRPRMDRPQQGRAEVHYSSVLVPAEYGYYGDIDGVSPNGMYKRYLGWFMGKYGTSKKPLAFKDWLVWARSKRLVLNTDGASEVVPSTDDVKKVAAGTGKRVAVAILIGMVAYFIINGMAIKNTTPTAS